MEEILIVDGYNIIGAWTELRELKERGKLEEARDQLIVWLEEYQVFSGREVIIVFDAHQVPGIGKKYQNQRTTIYYTKENETADELIERLVKELNRRKTQIYVATSDYTEQRVVFGEGALRISARELAIEKKTMEEKIHDKVKKSNRKIKSSILSALDDEMIKYFENWRRKK